MASLLKVVVAGGRQEELQRVDYNKVQYRDYAKGRALQPAQLAAWKAASAARLPAKRPSLMW